MRRLTAILAADVVGFSAMMTRNEEETLNRLIAFRNKHFDPIVARHNGRIVKLTGDGALVEFASVVDALGCALAIQTGVAEDDSTPIQLRIGVNLGDIIVAGRDIYGDGVNIAARLEALAEPGGICASGLVIDSIGTRINAPFTEMGLQNLHNIETPVPVFQWVPGGRPIGPKPTNQGSDHHSGKASIAVLAFDNMSTDPEQEYFSDGIAEDIITALSHFRDFFVIARNTSFSYKGQQVPVTQICRDLGVRYVLEGSVRRSGNRVRVTAQLIDGSRDTHIWASKFDRGLDNIFDLQDEITQAIVASVAPETMRAETLRARSKRPENLTAWDRVLQARWHLGTFQKSSNQTARTLLEEALSADAENSDVHSAIAQCELMAMLHFWSEEPGAAIQSARRAAETAVALDGNNANAHGFLGMAAMFARDYEAAEHHLTSTVSLNPNLAIGHGNFAAFHGVCKNVDAARDACDRAIALSPRDPLKAFWRGGYGIGLFVAGEYETCVTNARIGLKESPGFASLMRQETAALAMLGKQDEAQKALSDLLEKMPGLTIAKVRKMVPVRHESDWDRWLEGLRLAGLPNQ